MKGFAIVASLALGLSAAPVFAQAAGQARPAQPAGGQIRPAQPPATQPPAQPPAQVAPALPPSPPAPFPQGSKIAYVDFQRIASESTDGKASTAKIQALIQKKQNEIAEKTKQLQANQQKLQQSGGVMSEPARSQLEKEIERQQVDSQRFQQDAQAEINELQQELQNEFQRKVLPLLQQVAQEKGLQVLLSRADAGIVWAEPGLDLSAEVIKKLDGARPAPAPKP